MVQYTIKETTLLQVHGATRKNKDMHETTCISELHRLK